MGRVGKRPAPEGYASIKPFLDEVALELRKIENAPHEGLRHNEAYWPIFRLSHRRSRYIYDAFLRGEISRALYDWCLDEKLADAALIARWKKPGYEGLCCMRCIQQGETGFGGVCVCRVPREERLGAEHSLECQNCGCRGCGGARGKVGK